MTALSAYLTTPEPIGNRSGTANGQTVPAGGFPPKGETPPAEPATGTRAPFVSRGLPADWVILRDGQPTGHVRCPDENTAMILATYRYGADVTVRRQGAAAP